MQLSQHAIRRIHQRKISRNWVRAALKRGNKILDKSNQVTLHKYNKLTVVANGDLVITAYRG